MLDILDLNKIVIKEDGTVSFIGKNGEEYPSVEINLDPEIELPQHLDSIVRKFSRHMEITQESIFKTIDEILLNYSSENVVVLIKDAILSLKTLAREKKKLSFAIDFGEKEEKWL